MKYRLFASAVACLAISAAAGAAEVVRAVSPAAIKAVAARPFPKLLTAGPPADQLKKNLTSQIARQLADHTVFTADSLVKTPVTERKENHGQRLLNYSRQVQARIIALIVAYGLTGNEEYAERAKSEVLAAVRNREWYLRFYLDCAEMTLAVSLAYDWLYDRLTPAERDLIANAIIEKGLKTSLTPDQWWVSGNNNWCQVCHACMVAGAIVTADRDPELARKIINRALENLPKVMKHSYSPDGAYPEGPMYWSYGTNFNTLLFAILENAFGNLFGLDRIPGFDRTGDFITACTGNTGMYFSYGDSSTNTYLEFATPWLVKHFNRPDWVAASQYNALKKRIASRRPGCDRLLPLALLDFRLMPDHPDQSKGPRTYFSGGRNHTQIAVLRNGYDHNDTYLGIKGGTPSDNHGHMDAGSFVLESGGVRWCVDIGPSNYGELERKGVRAFFNPDQDSDRWKVFRVGPDSHNILRIDNGMQLSKGFARLTRLNDRSIGADLTSLYAGQAKSVRRTFTLLPGGAVEVRDEITGLRPGAEVAAQFCTAAADVIREPDGLLLGQNGKLLKVSADSSLPVEWRATPAEKLLRNWDPPEKDRMMIAACVKAPADGKVTLTTRFTPTEEE